MIGEANQRKSKQRNAVSASIKRKAASRRESTGEKRKTGGGQ
jgi:hypothetical protein